MKKELRLYRNSRRRRLGGVCAGIADLFRINVSWVRAAFLVSIFLSFGITFLSYVLIWIIFPVKPSLPIPDVSINYKRELIKLDKLVRRVHRQLDHTIADQVEETFDTIKLFAGQVESSTSENNKLSTVWTESTASFMALLKQLLSHINFDHDKIINNLNSLRYYLQKTGQDALHNEMNHSNMNSESISPELQAWKEKMAPIYEQLNDRVGPQILSILNKLEHKLAYLLSHEEPGQLFDVSRFEVKQIANKYIPEALNEYLKLPPQFARKQRLKNKVTAEEILSEQLIRLDHVLEELTISLFEKDAQGLLIHGRFLKDKFAGRSFKIDS